MLHSGPVGETADMSLLLESAVCISFQAANLGDWQFQQQYRKLMGTVNDF